MEKRLPGLTGKGPFSAFYFFFVKGAAAGGGICDCGSAGKGADTVDLIPAVARTANQAQALPFSCFFGAAGESTFGKCAGKQERFKKRGEGRGKALRCGALWEAKPLCGRRWKEI